MSNSLEPTAKGILTFFYHTKNDSFHIIYVNERNMLHCNSICKIRLNIPTLQQLQSVCHCDIHVCNIILYDKDW